MRWTRQRLPPHEPGRLKQPLRAGANCHLDSCNARTRHASLSLQFLGTLHALVLIVDSLSSPAFCGQGWLGL